MNKSRIIRQVVRRKEPVAPLQKQCISSTSASPISRNALLIYGINYSPEPIGVGRYTGEIGAYLAQFELEVDVVTAVPHYPGWALRAGYRNRYKVELLAGARITRCPLFLRAEMRGVWRLLAPLSFAISSAPVVIWRILTLRPKFVLCVEPTLLAAPIALLFARLVGARAILHVQDLELDAAFAVGHLKRAWFWTIATSFERAILAAFDAVVTISDRMRERLSAKGVIPSRLSVVRNWVDLEKIKPLSGSSEFRQELVISETAFIVLYSGHIGPKQALHLLLDAASMLVDYSRVLFVIAGEGPDKGLVMEKYGHLCNVRFLPLQPEERLCELLNLADVHVLPQRARIADLVLPSKLGGMLASGKPCIVMADPATELHQMLVDSAILVPAGDSNALAQAILHVVRGDDSPRLIRQLRLAEEFSATKNLPAIAEAIIGLPSAVTHGARTEPARPPTMSGRSPS